MFLPRFASMYSRTRLEIRRSVQDVLPILATFCLPLLGNLELRPAPSRNRRKLLELSRHWGASPSAINMRLFAALCLSGLIA